MRTLKIFILSLFISSSANALSVDAPLLDAKQEAMARSIFQDLRCVVCQGESIADSPAAVARDMRHAVREHISDGEDEATIKAYFREQYGERVLMMPSMRSNMSLWLSPLFIFMLGGYFAWRNLFQRPHR